MTETLQDVAARLIAGHDGGAPATVVVGRAGEWGTVSARMTC